MCYEYDARPPLPPVSGGSSTGTQLNLRSGDGTEFSAFSATADAGGRAGVVIMPDVRGLHPFYEELAVRFAEAGVHATAIDYFGRTAGVGSRGDDFEFMPHVAQTSPDTLALDVAAAVAHLRSPQGGGAEAVFTLGFCFGGRNSFNQAAEDHKLSGVIGFYGRLGEKRWPSDSDPPPDLAGRYRTPVLGLFGGDDPSIPANDLDAFRKALADAGIEHEIVVYDGAPHSFFDRAFEKYRRECDDAWTKTLAFIQRNAGGS